MHPVEIAARFHHWFTAIHPFDDGNGRMSRLLMNLMLMQWGFPPAVIRNMERDQYLAALRRADSDEYEDFIAFVGEHVLSSLELFIRAAHGEEIHEPTDLEKEITLLKMGLQPVEEPEPLSQEIQKKLFETSFNPLYAEIIKLISPLRELFTDSFISLSGRSGLHSSHDSGEERIAFSEDSKMPLLTDAWSGTNIVWRQRVMFSFTGFKKARFDTFDMSNYIELHFEPLKYRLDVPFAIPPISTWHFYQEALTKEEVFDAAQAVARFFIKVIRKKTNGQA